MLVYVWEKHCTLKSFMMEWKFVVRHVEVMDFPITQDYQI